ncbi:zinc ribbon domain-containing protein [Rhodobacteraceae bacterium B1Z28]|uniref:Zinc ribbon domain-containing protein n=1 Tax=Ruegeria haliotis TaxID=2747601 RepID=A0ABX2PPJ2_9RHOB|nr:zinc ribbon domain-containing protein [Ruegeria haliotis]NVO56033.1 zinc ribbon domain-containing protein [Ruegeria haliotis]
MALTTCYECEAKISDQAAACPNCGAPQHAIEDNVSTKSTAHELVRVVAGFVVVSFILTYGLNWLSQGEPPNPVEMVTDLLRQMDFEVGDLDCESIHDEVMALSKEHAIQNSGVTMQALVNISTESQSPKEVTCIGRATWSNSTNSRVEYSKTYRDGQAWLEFQELLF